MQLVSIVIPVWNAGVLLQECLESIFAQTYQDWEIIAVDDGATDGSGALLDAYAAKEPRLKVFHQSNRGEAAARNVGIEQARGEYLYFVDNDDYLHPQALETAVYLIQQAGTDGLVFDYVKAYERYQPPFLPLQKESYSLQILENPLQALLKDSDVILPPPWCKLYRRETIGETRFVEGIHFDDVPFNVLMLAKQKRIAVCKAPLYYFYNNLQSVSRGAANLKKLQSYPRIIRYLDDFFVRDKKLREQLRRQFYPQYVGIALGVLKKCRSDHNLHRQLCIMLRKELLALRRSGALKLRYCKIRKMLEILRLQFFNTL